MTFLVCKQREKRIDRPACNKFLFRRQLSAISLLSHFQKTSSLRLEEEIISMQYFPRERSSAIPLYGWMSSQKGQQKVDANGMRRDNSSGFDSRSSTQQRALLAAK
jgi:hypothetical protein